jgi:hypothetical protein
MFHACATRFDVTENLENFLVFRVNKALEKEAQASAQHSSTTSRLRTG